MDRRQESDCSECKKTEFQARILLLPVAQALIDKYENNPECSVDNKIMYAKRNNKPIANFVETAELCKSPSKK